MSTWKQLLKLHVIFILSTASMHGLMQIVRKNRLILERLLWILLVTVAFSMSTHQALKVWDRYENSPVVVTVKKDFFNWFVDFPSVFICLREKSESAKEDLEIFARRLNISVDDLLEFVDDLLFTTYHNYSMLEKYANGSKKDLVSSDLYLELVDVASGILPNDNDTKNMDFVRILTEYGVCHSFHSKLDSHFSIKSFKRDKSNRSRKRIISKNYKDGGIAFSQEITTNYMVFVESSNEMIDLTSHYSLISSSQVLILYLYVIDIVSDDGIKNLLPVQRNCKYSDEKQNLEHSAVYSYNLCRRECRINLALKYCNCTPYYYKRKNNEQVCSMTGMYCLSKHPELIRLGDDLCPCLQNCNLQKILIDVLSLPTPSTPSITVKFDSFPLERYKRSLIFTKTDLLIQVGGLFSLFLGCSVLSLIEIPYFLALRFFWGVFGKRSIKPEI